MSTMVSDGADLHILLKMQQLVLYLQRQNVHDYDVMFVQVR